MLPHGTLRTNLTTEIETTRTYRMLDDKIQGIAEELKALEQSIYKVLQTEKYEYPIYSFSYGIELDTLLGKDATYVKIELERRIKDCLLDDERILSVEDFKFTNNLDTITCEFHVNSIFGDLDITREVVI